VRFLADESCDARVVEALRRAGHDVLAVAESAAGAGDPDILAWSRRDQRILVTEDRDFGQLIFASGLPAGSGVLFLRCPEKARAALPEVIASLVERRGAELPGGFAVWSPRRFRVRPLGGT
jgi:predicted nuclease of predicted toxin-antitoxin system